MGAGASVDEEFRRAKEEHGMPLDLSSEDLHKFEGDLPPIRLIDYQKFKKHGEFPRFPDNKDIVTSLDQINRDKSLIVFISHCWLRGYPGAEGWDGRPHPDDALGSKYKLCVAGIDHILNLAPKVNDCYVWLDFGCIDQDGCPAGELRQLDKIVECSDVIFTPIFDAKESSWSYPPGWTSYFEQYKATSWNDGPHAYLNRGWCRVEMFYAANIPILENENPEIKRHSLFDAGLQVLTKGGHRPHMLYGTKEHVQSRQPWTMPPLQNSYLSSFNPMKGSLSKEEDVVHIIRLMEELKPYLKFVTPGYVGKKNAAGQPHGRGKFTWDTGMVYEGDYVKGVFEGKGVLLYPGGDRYEGEFSRGAFNGQGKLEYSSNGTYSGGWKDNLYHGHGEFLYPNGLVYKGNFECGQKHGEGLENLNAGEELQSVVYRKGVKVEK